MQAVDRGGEVTSLGPMLAYGQPQAAAGADNAPGADAFDIQYAPVGGVGFGLSLRPTGQGGGQAGASGATGVGGRRGHRESDARPAAARYLTGAGDGRQAGSEGQSGGHQPDDRPDDWGPG
jgi:hypothetical protein